MIVHALVHLLCYSYDTLYNSSVPEQQRKICSPLTLRFDISYKPPETIGLISLPSTFPLITTKNDRVTHKYIWVNVSDIMPEIKFLFGHKSYMIGLYTYVGHGSLVLRVTYICKFSPFSCTIQGNVGDKSFLTNSNGEIIVASWVPVNDVKPYVNGHDLDSLKKAAAQIITRWSTICRVLLEADYPFGNRQLQFWYRERPPWVWCTMNTSIPLRYSLYLQGENLKTIRGNAEVTGQNLLFTATNGTPSFYNISRITCLITSPLGWLLRLQNPDKQTNIIHVTHTTSSVTVDEIVLSNRQNSNVTGGITVGIFLLFVICIILLIMFRKKLGLRFIDTGINQLRERLQYSRTETSDNR